LGILLCVGGGGVGVGCVFRRYSVRNSLNSFEKMSVPTENNFPPFHDYLQKSCPVERPEINGTMY